MASEEFNLSCSNRLNEVPQIPFCNRDGAFCEGYDPKLKLERTQTIMQGASHCDFRYRYEK